ncbi:hypothetical protein PM082_004206 [Marasmius tenuissimus]|nr:hypothetical protein PM082_004206 [Marasmius tenuissimus]
MDQLRTILPSRMNLTSLPATILGRNPLVKDRQTRLVWLRQPRRCTVSCYSLSLPDTKQRYARQKDYKGEEEITHAKPELSAHKKALEVNKNVKEVKNRRYVDELWG